MTEALYAVLIEKQMQQHMEIKLNSVSRVWGFGLREHYLKNF